MEHHDPLKGVREHAGRGQVLLRRSCDAVPVVETPECPVRSDGPRLWLLRKVGSCSGPVVRTEGAVGSDPTTSTTEGVVGPALGRSCCVPFVRGLLHARRSTAADGRLDENAETARARPARTFAHVVALTAIDPATVLYVTALTLALADRIRSLGARLAFLAGIGIGLFGWQARRGVRRSPRTTATREPATSNTSDRREAR